MPARLAFMLLATYPEVIADGTRLVVAGFVATLEFGLRVSAFSVDIPQIYSPLSTSASTSNHRQ